MNIIKLLPVICSLLLLAAHFLRAGVMPLVGLVLFLPFLLLIRRVWVARIIQISLVFGALEWLRTLFSLIDLRQEAGQPWARLAVILGVVAAGTGLSVWIFRCTSMKARYEPAHSSTNSPPQKV